MIVLGIILIVIGLILRLLGSMARAVCGRRTYYRSMRFGPSGSRPRGNAALQRLRTILDSIQKY